MKFNLLTNGIDSLKASHECLLRIEQLAQGVEHNVKDAIMYLNHANEILFKLVLKNYKEYLMFSDISQYMKAKEAMLQQSKSNVFDINPNLKTVNFAEAIRRLEFLCDIEISPKFKGSLQYLNQIRNKIMHFEIELPEEDVGILIRKLKICQYLSIEFFNEHLEDFDILFEAVRFEYTVEEYNDDMGELYAEMYSEDARIEYEEAAYGDLGEGK
ncbi:hypothetical protein [Bacillus sp. B4EP4a]|uniref:hypothetical protein n=1 Tax=Bacillus sp. B4EP4a TaxID=2590665 RepID=UPI001152E764|nr:hypothetical protein [Bacillus sp. B4EP4a]